MIFVNVEGYESFMLNINRKYQNAMLRDADELKGKNTENGKL